MADAPVDFSSLDFTQPVMDFSVLDMPISADTTPASAVAPDAGLFGSVGTQTQDASTFPGLATADTLGSTDGINLNANSDSNWADGSSAIGLSGTNPTFFDSNGNVLQATQDKNGYYHLSDGSIVDPFTGNKFNADGNNPPVDPSVPSAPSQGGTGGISPAIGGPKAGGSGNAAVPGLAALSKTIGSLGAALASILGKPQRPSPQQLALNRATIAGRPSMLNMSGVSVFVIGGLVLIFVLLKGR